MFKKLLCIILSALLTITILPFTLYASDNSIIDNLSNIDTIVIENETYYVKTYLESYSSDQIQINASNSAGIITETKTSEIYNQSGAVMVRISITGTFSYNGSNATCTGCSGSAISYSSQWTVPSYYCSRSGNSATNYATVTHSSGGVSNSYPFSVTITCTSNGTIY